MPASTVQLVARTRKKANVQRSNFADDNEIVEYLNELRKKLHKLLIAADDSYYVSRVTLTTIGSTVDTNSAVLPADFYKVRGLSARAGTTREFPVDARSFHDRYVPGEIGYTLDGDSISIWRPADAARYNPYVLRYTPRPRPLALPVTYAIPQTAAQDGTNVSGNFVFPGGTFSDAGMIGGTLVIAGDTAVGSLNGTYTVTGFAVVGPNTTLIVTPAPSPSHTMTGAYTATLTYQPDGTDAVLDATADDYIEYLTSGAAAPILSKKRQMDAAAAKLAECAKVEAELAQLATMRQSEPKQAPVLKRFDTADDCDE